MEEASIFVHVAVSDISGKVSAACRTPGLAPPRPIPGTLPPGHLAGPVSPPAKWVVGASDLHVLQPLQPSPQPSLLSLLTPVSQGPRFSVHLWKGASWLCSQPLASLDGGPSLSPQFCAPGLGGASEWWAARCAWGARVVLPLTVSLLPPPWPEVLPGTAPQAARLLPTVKPSVCPASACLRGLCAQLSVSHGLHSVSLVLQWASPCPKSTFRRTVPLGARRYPSARAAEPARPPPACSGRPISIRDSW